VILVVLFVLGNSGNNNWKQQSWPI